MQGKYILRLVQSLLEKLLELLGTVRSDGDVSSRTSQAIFLCHLLQSKRRKFLTFLDGLYIAIVNVVIYYLTQVSFKMSIRI